MITVRRTSITYCIYILLASIPKLGICVMCNYTGLRINSYIFLSAQRFLVRI